MSSVEYGPNGAVVAKDPAVLDSIKQELAQREHAYPDGKTRPVGGLARWASRALIGVAVMEVVLVLALVIVYFQPSLLPGDDGVARAGFAVQVLMWMSFAYYAIGLTAFVLTCRITFRAMKNLYTIASPDARMSPGWTVGWYFIPFANFWLPVMGMSQIWRGSHRALGEVPPSRVLTIWWASWVAGPVPNWLIKLWPTAIEMRVFLLLVGTGLGVAAALALRVILLRLADCQDRYAAGGIGAIFD